jgi:PAS domain S-box-containing protein
MSDSAAKSAGSQRQDEIAQKKLAELEQIYQTAPVGLLFVDPDLRYVRINERLAQLNGKSVREHIGRTIREVAPDIAAIVEPLCRQVIAARQPILNYELSAHAALQHGSDRVLVASYYPVVDGATVLGISGVVQDITERKQAEMAVRTSEAQLRLVIDSLPGLISYIDRDFRHGFVNRSYENWTGKPLDQITGKTVAEAFGQESFEQVRPMMERALLGEAVTFELSCCYQAGASVRDISAMYVPDTREDGSVQGFLASITDITERKRDREAIQHGEERYRRIVETAAEGIWTVDGQGRTTFANDRIARLLGYTPEELIGRWAFDFVFEEDRDLALQKFTASRQDPLSPYDFRLRRRDGSEVWVNIAANPLFDRDGAFLGVLAMFTDVGERKRAEVAQRAVEKQLALLVEASSTLLASPESTDVLKAILDLTKRFIDADAYSVWRRPAQSGAWRIEAMQGLGETYDRSISHDAGDADQIPLEPIVIEDVEDYPLVGIRLAAYRAEGIRSLIAVPIWIQHDVRGTIVFYYRSRHHFTDLEVRVASALGNLASAALGTAELYTREIQLRRLAESQERKARFLDEAGEALSSSLDYERNLATVLELAVPVFADWACVDLLDESGEVRRIAAKHSEPEKIAFAYELQHRFPSSEMVSGQIAIPTGKSILLEEISDDPLPQDVGSREYLELIQKLGLHSVITVPLVANARAFAVLSFVIAESPRRFTQADLGLAEELARRAATVAENARLYVESKKADEALRRSNEELRRANEDLNQFAYSASHDLQEPLRMVAVFSQLLARKYSAQLDAEGQKYVGFTLQGARRMEMLLKDLLAYTQAINYSVEDLTPIDANAVFEKSLSNLGTAIREAGAVVTRGELPMVRIQEIHLLQLFQNLIGNAIKYRRETAINVRVTCEPEGGFWKVCVQDNGIGIASVYASHIFGIFKRLHNSDKYAGTGIGLAICQKIVERYGGRIWVESEEGHGSIFCFTIPRSDR